MKSWVFTFSVVPPEGTISARNGSSVFFAAYSKALRQWYMVVPGGQETIDEPQMLFLPNDYVKENRKDRLSSIPPGGNIFLGCRLLKRKSKAVQCELKL